MAHLTFKDYLCKIVETIDDDLANLNLQKQQLTMKKANQDQQIDNQLASINRLIFQKEKQKQTDQTKTDSSTQQQTQTTQQQQAQQAGTQTTTPGSSGAQTPGGQQSSAAPLR